METLKFVANIASIITLIVLLPVAFVSLGLVINKKKIEKAIAEAKEREKAIKELKSILASKNIELEKETNVGKAAKIVNEVQSIENEIKTLENEKK